MGVKFNPFSSTLDVVDSPSGDFADVELDQGTAAAPSISFNGDPNTGIYSPGADQVAISTNGAGALFIDSSGNVGVGVSSPLGRFEVGAVAGNVTRGDLLVDSTSGSAVVTVGRLSSTGGDSTSFKIRNRVGAQIFLTDATTGNTAIGTDSSPSEQLTVKAPVSVDPFSVSGPSSEFLRITSDGKLGLGTSSPDALLTVNGIASFGAGAVGAPSIAASGDLNTGFWFPGGDTIAASTGGTERLRIAGALVGIGATNPAGRLHVAGVNPQSIYIENTGDQIANVGTLFYRMAGQDVASIQAERVDTAGRGTHLKISTAQVNTGTLTERVRIDSSGRVGIGTASPAVAFQVGATGSGGAAIDTTNSTIHGTFGSGGNLTLRAQTNAAAGGGEIYLGGSTRGDSNVNAIIFSAANSERARIDSSGRLLVGTSSVTDTNPKFVVEGRGVSGTQPAQVHLRRSEGAASITSGEAIGFIAFTDNADNQFAFIGCSADADAGSGDYPGRLVFSTTADSASSPTERMRITNGGFVNIGSQGTDVIWNQTSVAGVNLGTSGVVQVARSNDTPLLINRIGNDGKLIVFAQDGNEEGDISVSGSTVALNGAHLSRWSQLPGGAERIELLRGTVLSNIDEMCIWGEEDNEQLNRMKVSDVEGDPNVAGVFQAWDDDDDTYTDDFYCAMTGDFIIRIAEGVTVQRGDLLMSAGDGTAKPQDDDIIRSKTIAKVTSTHVTCTYDDGSYCVPCVLMAC